jgi:hypothetical protein
MNDGELHGYYRRPHTSDLDFHSGGYGGRPTVATPLGPKVVERSSGKKSGSRCQYKSRRPPGLDDCVLVDEERRRSFCQATSQMDFDGKAGCQAIVTPESDTTEVTRAPSSIASASSLEPEVFSLEEVEGIRSPRPSKKVGLLGRSPEPRERQSGGVRCRAALMGRPRIPVYGTLVQL